jgi:hypothetical protein
MIRYTDINTGNNLLDESLENYLMHGFEPGGFLTSVLANDLYLAVGRADHWNKERLPKIVNEVLHKMPSISWGSYAAVKEWCADKDGRRSQYAERKEKEYTWRALKGEIRVKEPQDSPF